MNGWMDCLHISSAVKKEETGTDKHNTTENNQHSKQGRQGKLCAIKILDFLVRRNNQKANHKRSVPVVKRGF